MNIKRWTDIFRIRLLGVNGNSPPNQWTTDFPAYSSTAPYYCEPSQNCYKNFQIHNFHSLLSLSLSLHCTGCRLIKLISMNFKPFFYLTAFDFRRC